MTIRNLDQCFRPRSVAIVGASQRPQSVGAIVLKNVRTGGFEGEIYPVNPKYERIDGIACYRNSAQLPDAPDLAVIVTPIRLRPASVTSASHSPVTPSNNFTWSPTPRRITDPR